MYKWYQNQSYVHLHIRLPESAPAKQVQPAYASCMAHPGRSAAYLLYVLMRQGVLQVAVSLTPLHLQVRLWETALMEGQLYQPVKQEDSTWVIQDGILHFHLLKRNRRGHYANGCTNADTFWRGVFASAGPEESLTATHPPACYYTSFVDPDDVPNQGSKINLPAQAKHARQVEA